MMFGGLPVYSVSFGAPYFFYRVEVDGTRVVEIDDNFPDAREGDCVSVLISKKRVDQLNGLDKDLIYIPQGDGRLVSRPCS